MTAIVGETPLWHLEKEELYDVLRRGERERRRIYLESLEVIEELLGRTAGDKDDVAALCADMCAGMGITRREALRMIERTKLLRREKVRRAAQDDGLSPEHLAAIDRALTKAPAADRDKVEEHMLADAANVEADGMEKMGRRILQLLDQDGKQPKDEDLAQPRRELHCTTRRDGSMDIRARIDAEAGATLTAMISPLAKPTSADDQRDLAQRQGDALVEVIELAAGNKKTPTEAGERPHVAVTVDLEVLQKHTGTAKLGDEGYIDAASARRIACDCKVLPIVLGSKSDPLDFGRQTRTIPHRLRRALIARDRGCAFPQCQRPPRQCHGHHLVHWADGGPTSLDNTVLLCGHHHRVIHHSGWEVVMVQQKPEFRTPPYLTGANPSSR
ncbi:MAG TPA: DUF222 domain-containing protein [Kutzneria sp.]